MMKASPGSLKKTMGLARGPSAPFLDGGAVGIGLVAATRAPRGLQTRLEARQGFALRNGDEILGPVEQGNAIGRIGRARALEFGLVIAGEKAAAHMRRDRDRLEMRLEEKPCLGLAEIRRLQRLAADGEKIRLRCLRRA